MEMEITETHNNLQHMHQLFILLQFLLLQLRLLAMWRDVLHAWSRSEGEGPGLHEHVHVEQQHGAVAQIVVVLPPAHPRHALGQPIVHEGDDLVVLQVPQAPEGQVLHPVGGVVCRT